VAAGVDFEEQITSYAGEATEITRTALRSGVARIIAVGGDGTLGEIVNGYLDDLGKAINDSASIGLLPSGTGSDFCRSVGPVDRRDLIKTLINPETRLIDAARAEFQTHEGSHVVRTFLNVASFGLGGDVSARVNHWRGKVPRWIGGRVKFAAAAIAALGRYKNVDVCVQVDEREIKINSNLVVVANGRFAGGGMMLAPHAELDDGFLDVILTDEVTRWDVIKELPRIQRGSHLKNRKVSEWRGREVSIVAEEPMLIDLDGEMVGRTPARIKVLPSAIRFLNPSTSPPSRR
jgi:YegS/Rv2252/BmrU family lipid kinase